MTTINPLDQYGAAARSAGGAARSVEDMGSQDFLELMVAQLQNQDPTSPMDNMQFMSELAQFGTVSGIQELNESFNGLAGSLASSQNLQAVSMVGRDVMVDSNVGLLRQVDGAAEDAQLALDATVELPAGSSAATLYITDMAGRLVYSGALPHGGGELPVRWDGLDSSGQAVDPGLYRVSAAALVNGQSQALSVYAHQRVESVSLPAGGGGATLQLSDGQSVEVDEVRAFL